MSVAELLEISEAETIMIIRYLGVEFLGTGCSLCEPDKQDLCHTCGDGTFCVH